MNNNFNSLNTNAKKKIAIEKILSIMVKINIIINTNKSLKKYLKLIIVLVILMLIIAANRKDLL